MGVMCYHKYVLATNVISIHISSSLGSTRQIQIGPLLVFEIGLLFIVYIVNPIYKTLLEILVPSLIT